MRIGFISDIHGNFEALNEVLKTLDKMHVDKIYCLGDVAGYYTQINECCDELRKRKIPNIMGNHDWYLTEGFCSRSRGVNDCLDFQRSVITESNFAWLRESALFRTIDDFRMVHGGWSDPIDEYLHNPNEKYFLHLKGRYFISGHTHVPKLADFGEKIYCNPGSVGQSRDGNTKASFAVFEDGIFRINRIDYNIEKVCSLMKQSGFSEGYYQRLREGR